ncbi:MAG: oxidoreductase, partial [Verrucomicrobia bacterium]
MESGKKIKCGVAGVGFLGQVHARVYNELEDCEFVGIYEIDDKRGQEICDLYGCKRFGSLKELGEACDAVSVVVPTDRHHAVAMELLDVGTHLLIEKPLCTSVKEATEIANLAKAKNCVVQVGHVEHYNPVVSYLEKVVNKPQYITVDRLAPFNVRGTEVGVVLDLMIHDISIVMQLVQSPIKRIESIGVCVLLNTEDIANARITFENGTIANLNASRVSLKKVREIRVFQPSAYLSLDFMNQTGHLIRKGLGGLEKEEIPIEKGEPLKIELAAFIQCIK